ncbi:unnamed protein product, partial [Prunus brigantina]
KSEGSIERFKARLVANGFHQQEGLNYIKTFSLVVKHTTIRMVLSLEISKKWSGSSRVPGNSGRVLSGPLNYFLGIEVTYKGDCVHLTQAKYATDLLVRTGFTDYKPLSTPCASGQKLSMYYGEPLCDPTEYRQVVGAL